MFTSMFLKWTMDFPVIILAKQIWLYAFKDDYPVFLSGRLSTVTPLKQTNKNPSNRNRRQWAAFYTCSNLGRFRPTSFRTPGGLIRPVIGCNLIQPLLVGCLRLYFHSTLDFKTYFDRILFKQGYLLHQVLSILLNFTSTFRGFKSETPKNGQVVKINWVKLWEKLKFPGWNY